MDHPEDRAQFPRLAVGPQQYRDARAVHKRHPAQIQRQLPGQRSLHRLLQLPYDLLGPVVVHLAADLRGERAALSRTGHRHSLSLPTVFFGVSQNLVFPDYTLLPLRNSSNTRAHSIFHSVRAQNFMRRRHTANFAMLLHSKNAMHGIVNRAWRFFLC